MIFKNYQAVQEYLITIESFWFYSEALLMNKNKMFKVQKYF